VATEPLHDSRPDSDEETVRTGEQEVAAGKSDETPAAVLFTVIAVIGALVVIALGIAALAYWLA
jgi:hypothetical protein